MQQKVFTGLQWMHALTFILFITAVFFVPVAAVYGQVDWTAYNDCTGITGGHTTSYTDYLDYMGNTAGLLKNAVTGSTSGMPAIIFTIPADEALQPVSRDDYGVNPNPDTDAYAIFNGKIDFSGTIIQHSSTCNTGCWFVEMMFSNLDPSKEYTFAGSAFRNTTYDDRYSRYTIRGALNFTNNSSDGILSKNGAVTQLLAADNSNEGHVVRWDNIQPAPDGTFTIYADSSSVNGRHGYPLHGFMLQQIDTAADKLPNVNAGPDKEIYLLKNGTAQLNIDTMVTGDAPLTMEWTQASGPDTVIFSPDDNAKDVTVTFPTSGQYILQLKAEDTMGQYDSDQVMITVYKPPAMTCPRGDLNDDCYVDLDDLAIFVTQWLNTACIQNSCADFNNQRGVDLNDYAIISESWNSSSESTIIINEFMAVNSYVPFVNPLAVYTRYAWKTGDNVYPDWIELYNSDSEAINLAGWYLTDTSDDKTKWQFPFNKGSELVLEPGGFLVVFASNKEMSLFSDNYPYVDYYGSLHTNFKLGSSGEYLALVKPDGKTVAYEYNDYPEQYPFVSYGISQDGNVGYLVNPTPGITAGNRWTGGVNSIAYPGKVADTKFNRKRGFYETAFDVTISCNTAGAEIHYTLDGTEPQPTVGGSTLLYSRPITISTTTCLRARACKDDLLPSNVDTQTYLFLDEVVEQTRPSDSRYAAGWGGYPADYEMESDTADVKLIAGNAGYTVNQARTVIKNALKDIPTLSVVTSPDNLFADTIGIYTNTYNSGINWERPVSAEYFGSTNEAFQIDCGLRLQGGASRVPYKSPKHSLSLRFRGGYGDAKLKNNLFKQTSVNEFDSLQLRAMYNNSWIHLDPAQRHRATMIRDQFVRDCLIAMGQESAGAGVYVHLYLNGLYWGIYNLHERPEASHYSAYYGGEADFYDAVNGGEMIDGDSDQWNYLRSTILSANPSSQLDWQQINSVIDIENYIDWTIIQHYAKNQDLKSNGNWRAAGGGIFGALWQFYAWDTERTFEDGSVAAPRPSSDLNLPFFLGFLKNFEEFRIQFSDRIYKHFHNGGALTYASARNRFNIRAAQLHNAIIAESARWGDNRRDSYQTGGELYTRNAFWLPGLSDIDDYLQEKETSAVTHFKNFSPPLYPSIEPPVFRVNSIEQSGGFIDIPCSFEMVSNIDSGDIYYTLDRTDPREYWTGNKSSSAILYNEAPITFNKSAVVKARVKNSSIWSALHEAAYADRQVPDSLRISEIMYHPADPNTEFIELLNVGTETINLKLAEFIKGVDFIFDDVTLSPDQYILIVQDQSAFEDKYGTELNIAGQYTGRLDNDGDRIKFKDAVGTEILDFNFKDSWYELTDGAGFSLTMINPASTDPNDWENKDNWRPSLYKGGTPGSKAEITLNKDSIVINELLAHSHAETPDWIELYNTTARDINIGGWFLSDDNTNPDSIRKYEIPAGTVINAKSFKLFYQDISFGDPSLPIDRSFGLSEGGETLHLYSGQNGQLSGYYQTEQRFDASQTDVSFGRYEKSELSGGYDFVRMLPSPGTANALPLIPDLVITEIHYAPAEGTDYEFIELYNRTTSPVKLMTQVSTETSPGVFVKQELPWRIKGISYDFPADTVISAGERVIAARNPDTYRSLACRVFGPCGKLDNSGEQVELQIPGDQELGKNRYWIPIEKIKYDNKSPWPAGAHEGGYSLHRVNPAVYGRDYSNWTAAAPTPGQ